MKAKVKIKGIKAPHLNFKTKVCSGELWKQAEPNLYECDDCKKEFVNEEGEWIEVD